MRVAACTPRICVGDPQANTDETLVMMREGESRNCDLMLFPELGISAYAIDDLLLQDGRVRPLGGRAVPGNGAVEQFDGAGFLGRQVSSVGSGMVVDAGQGRALFGEVWLPLGPAWVRVRPGAKLGGRVNLRDVGTLIWAATRPELGLDLEASLSNGAPVFVAESHQIVNGSRPVAGAAIGFGLFAWAANPPEDKGPPPPTPAVVLY